MTPSSSSSDRPRVVVYTAIIDDYDLPLPPRQSDPDVDYILLSNTPMPKARGWTVRPLPEPARDLPSGDANRWCKMFAHEIFPEYGYSVYLDGNIRIVSNLKALRDEFIASHAAIGLFKHPTRSTIDEECTELCASPRFSPEEKAAMLAQLNRYRGDMPTGCGVPLSENSIIFRNHRATNLAPAMQLWWEEYRHNSKRDQLALPWVLQKVDLSVHRWDWSFRHPNPHFIRMPHFSGRSGGAFSAARYYLSMHRKTLRNRLKARQADHHETRATDA